MKQLIFLVGMMTYCTLRSMVDPFWGVLMYYMLSVLRPQAIWEWALPQNIRWSLIAAVVTVVAVVMNLGSLKHRVVQNRFILGLAAFGFFLMGSYCLAKNYSIAEKIGWEYCKILIMLIISCYVVTERRHIRYLAWMILLCLMFLVYEVNYRYVFQHRLDIYHSGYGGMDNNGAALMLAMVIPFCFYFFQAEKTLVAVGVPVLYRAGRACGDADLFSWSHVKHSGNGGGDDVRVGPAEISPGRGDERISVSNGSCPGGPGNPDQVSFDPARRSRRLPSTAFHELAGGMGNCQRLSAFRCGIAKFEPVYQKLWLRYGRTDDP